MTNVKNVKLKLNRAFSELRALDINARENFCCCSSCAMYELDKQAIEATASGKEIKGSVYYHGQDNDSFLEGNNLMIRYCETEDDDGQRITTMPVKNVGDLVYEVLSHCGLALKWDGESSSCIQVLGAADGFAESTQIELPF
jgi:hypothetical protein